MVTQQPRAEVVARAVAAGRALQQVLDSDSDLLASHSDRLFSRELTARGSGAAILRLLPTLEQAVREGHRAHLDLTDDSGLRIEWRQGIAPDIECDLDLVTDPNGRAALGQARDSNDVATVLGLLPTSAFRLRATLSARADGVAWIPSATSLSTMLSSGSWLSAVQQLTKCRDDNGRAAIFIEDLVRPVLTDTFMFVRGVHDIQPFSPSTPADLREIGYLTARRNRLWPEVPAPTALRPIGGDKTELGTNLAAAAAALTWLWLAADAPAVTATSVHVCFRGVKDLEVELTPTQILSPAGMDDHFRLYQWATSAGDDALKDDAVQRAISLAVAGPGDLVSAARPVLRTATTLHNLATSGAVSEALSTRRDAQAAASAAAHSAASTAREASGKATERTLALAIAGTGVVFASLQEILDRRVAVIGLVVLTLLLIANWLITRKVDIATATSTLEAFENDIVRYRDALSSEEIEDLKRLKVLDSGRKSVKLAKRATTALCFGSVLLAIAFALLLALPIG